MTLVLDRVTFTGADDSVKQEDLLAISKEFPFVEWGILMSTKHQGSNRFPTWNWLNELREMAGVNGCMRLSAHLCGKHVRDVLAGFMSNDLRETLEPFSRMQLNFHNEPHYAILKRFHEVLGSVGSRQWIFQYDEENFPLYHWANDIRLAVNAVPLFDMSHGAGICPDYWPKSFDNYCGYAGGLGPDNIKEQLVRIEEAARGRRIWIDMEKNVRTPDDRVFDLDKVRSVIEQVRPLVVQPAAVVKILSGLGVNG